jgi:hypothetical protein
MVDAFMISRTRRAGVLSERARRRRTAAGRRVVRRLMFLAASLALGAHLHGANPVNRPATASVTVSALAKLTLSSTTLAFPDADPDTTPNIPASGGALTITAKARTTIGSTVTLTVQAANDLKSGLDTILATQMQWTATGTGFVPGRMSKTAAQSVAAWTGSGSWTGAQSYTLVNAWTYATGTYSTTLTYTLTAP